MRSTVARCLAATAVALAAPAAMAGAVDGPPPTGDGLCAPAPAAPTSLVADASHAGVIGLYFFNAPGPTVNFYECVGGHAHYLGGRATVTGGPVTPFYDASQWRCGLQSRSFAAAVALPDGTLDRATASVETPPCTHRFRLFVPPRMARAQAAAVRVTDGWDLGGIHTTLCFISPAARRRCVPLAFPPAVNVLGVRFRPHSRGHWALELWVRGTVIRAAVAVGVRPAAAATPLPVVLATGDSTIGGVDSFLDADLDGRATVVGDEHPGSSLSGGADWPAIAARQVARLRPAVTVVSLGANEGFPLTAVDGSVHACCDSAWVGEYARRLRALMLAYRRGGRGRVVWLTIVSPRQAAQVPAVDAVNAAILRAAAGLPGVQVLRMDLLFSPHGYQQTIRFRGREVDVREPDGVHLDIAGTAIEAQQVATALTSGALAPPSAASR
jgi:hypothetical protein